MASTLLISAQDIFRKDDDLAGYKNIIAEFPPGSRLISARPLGKSTWTNTTHLSVEHPDGTEKVYFLRCAQFEDGRVLVQGEFNAMSELYATAPGFVPKPYTWGTCYLDDTEAYFFISEFIDFSGKLPEPDRLCRKLVNLHQRSVSPTGKFGFHATTCQGRTAQSVPWERSWTVFFSNLLAHVVGLDAKTNGPWENFEILARRCVEAVVLRLIGALERDGRKVKPCLIHGDLWEGNTGTSLETGIFTSSTRLLSMRTTRWKLATGDAAITIYTIQYTPRLTWGWFRQATRARSGMTGIAFIQFIVMLYILSTTDAEVQLYVSRMYLHSIYG